MSFTVYNGLTSDGTVARTEMTTLDKIDFPAAFKICMQPSFNDAELEEVGYHGARDYFAGQSRFSKTSFGWAGHTPEGKPFSNASDVQKRIFLDYGSVINKTWVFVWDLKDAKGFKFHTIPGSSFQLRQPNFPNNCLILDITTILELKGIGKSIMAMGFVFNPDKFATEIEINVKDRLKMLRRSYLHSKNKYIGPTIWTDDLTERIQKTYTISFKQDIFFEDNQNKNCVVYPTQYYGSYDDCDQQVLGDLLKNDSVSPAWASPEDLHKATNISNGPGLSLKAHLFYLGYLPNSCPNPCIETSIHSSYGNTVPSMMDSNGTALPSVSIAINPDVEVTRHVLQRYTFDQFLLDLGSCSGTELQNVEIFMEANLTGRFSFGFCRKCPQKN